MQYYIVYIDDFSVTMRKYQHTVLVVLYKRNAFTQIAGIAYVHGVAEL